MITLEPPMRRPAARSGRRIRRPATTSWSRSPIPEPASRRDPRPGLQPVLTTKEVGKGSGLGLSQVLGVAQQLGGGVRIDTTPGIGTTVKVYLPSARVDEVHRAPTGIAPPRRRPHTPGR